MKEKIWGGQKIKNILGFDFAPMKNCGELWTLSAVEGEETPVSNGFLAEATLKEVLEMYADELIGEVNFSKYRTNFPLLLKIIDAADNLSLQVHPDDNYAQSVGFANGKNEMWYIMNADQRSFITSGFRKKVSKIEIMNAVRNNTLTDILNKELAFENDVFYIPAGRVHAIGGGIMLAEIQQNSDLTYRIYDYNRTDKNGNKRQLHLKEAMEVMNLSFIETTAKHYYENHLNHTHNIIDTPFFFTNIINLASQYNIKRDYSQMDTFVIYFCVGGSAKIETMTTNTDVKAGEAVLIPAVANDVTIISNNGVKILEITII